MNNKLLKQLSVITIGIALCISSAAVAENFMKKTDRALDRQSPRGEGTGVLSFDAANATLGIFNVEGVFEVFHANEPVRDLDTRLCAMMGVSELASGSGSTGKHCCEKLWETEGDTLHEYDGVGKKMRGFFAGRNENKKDKLKHRYDTPEDARNGFIDYCCRMSDEKFKDNDQIFCKTVAQEKAGCVNGELKKNNQNMEEALSACKLECDIKKYGNLKHNEDGKYDEKEVNDMVKACTMDNVEWAPSTTVPGAKAFLPAIPTDISKFLTSKEGS